MSKRSFGLFSLMIVGLFVLAACADPQQPTATPVNFAPTPAVGTATAITGGSPVVPQPTNVPFVPDPAAGQAIFDTQCAFCHNTDSTTNIGPGLGGIGVTAATRISDVSADDYIRQSIKEPGSFVVDSFDPVMPQLTALTDEDIENLLAYLKTLQ